MKDKRIRGTKDFLYKPRKYSEEILPIEFVREKWMSNSSKNSRWKQTRRIKDALHSATWLHICML